MLTQKNKILETFLDMCWHSRNELIELYYKFSARMTDLRKEGFVFEKKSINGQYYYRLAMIPDGAKEEVATGIENNKLKIEKNIGNYARKRRLF